MLNRKFWQIILALMCFAAVAVLIVIGVKRTTQSDVIDGLESLGLKTFEAFDDKPYEKGADEPDDVDDSVTYIIYYHYFDPKYGEIIFSQGVDNQVHGDYQLSMLIAAENPEYAKVYTVDRYVYVYRLNGETTWIFEDEERTLEEVSKIIDPTVKTSSTIYYTVAGILTLAGAYLLFLVFVPKRPPETSMRS